MDETTRAVLTSWNPRPEIVLFLLGMGLIYTIGWVRMRRIRTTSNKTVPFAAGWRLCSFWLGIGLLALALISPIETLSSQLFTMHMIQHLLLGMFAPPLLLGPNPMPVMMWGLPLGVRKRIGRILFSKKSRIRPIITAATRPVFVWMAFFIILWGWHDPDMYNLTLINGFVHDFEHLTFYWSAMLLWWHITGAAPHFHKRFGYPGRIGFTLSCLPANMLAGVAIALSTSVIYTYYETVPFRIWNISVIDDQTLGGAIMWVPGSMMYVIAVVALLSLWLESEKDDLPQITLTDLDREGKLNAPHLSP